MIWRRGGFFVFNLNTSMLQVKKQEKMIKKLRRLVEEKARRLTKYEIRGDESEEEPASERDKSDENWQNNTWQYTVLVPLAD